MNAITDYRQRMSFVSGNQKESEQWYILVIVNPLNGTNAVDVFMHNYEYLNDRTGNVHYFLPGFNNNIELNGEVCSNRSFGLFTRSKSLSEIDGNDFTFYRKGMLETVNWLEGNCLSYEYREGIDLILMKSYGQRRNAQLDVKNLICVPLEQIHQRGGNMVDAITFVRKIVTRNLSFEEAQQEINSYLESNIGLYQQPLLKVFIAGSKALFHERNLVRSQLQQISNRTNIIFSCYTYEDFSREFIENGQQAEYNKFIANQADFAVFVIDGRIGGITFDEFNVAMVSFKKKGKPRIFIYCKDIDTDNPEIHHIINEIMENHQYYCEYRDIYHLESNIYHDFMDVAWELKR